MTCTPQRTVSKHCQKALVSENNLLQVNIWCLFVHRWPDQSLTTQTRHQPSCDTSFIYGRVSPTLSPSFSLSLPYSSFFCLAYSHWQSCFYSTTCLRDCLPLCSTFAHSRCWMLMLTISRTSLLRSVHTREILSFLEGNHVCKADIQHAINCYVFSYVLMLEAVHKIHIVVLSIIKGNMH